jgi:hypothetical protein
MFSNNKKFVQYLAFSTSEAALFPRKFASNFFIFFIPFYVGSGSQSGLAIRTVMHSGSGSAKSKSYGSCDFGSTALLFTQCIFLFMAAGMYLAEELRYYFPKSWPLIYDLTFFNVMLGLDPNLVQEREP